jgi:hypothetical protein
LQRGIQHVLAIFFPWMGTYHPALGTVRAVERSLNASLAKQGCSHRVQQEYGGEGQAGA